MTIEPFQPRGRAALARTGANPDATISAETEEMFWQGIPASTREVYEYQWLRFVRWCGDDALGPPHPRDSLEATPHTVADYIRAHKSWKNGDGRLAGRNGQAYAPDTVRLALAVISVAHRAHGMLSPTAHELVIKTMRGYHREWVRLARLHGWKRAVAYAPTPQEIISMVEACDLTTLAGIRDALLIRLQAEIGRRNSELVELDIADLEFPDPYRMLVHIRFSKTDQDGQGTVAMVEADRDWHPDTCPVLLARELIQLMATRGCTRGPLFLKIAAGQRAKTGLSGQFRSGERMDRKNYQDVITKAGKLSGVDHDPVTGEPRILVPHSLRAAFATNGSAAGVPLGLICDQGGWNRESPVVLKYQRAGNRWGDNNPGAAIRKAARARDAQAEG